MIFGKEETQIVKLAVENQSTLFDGVVQYNYETGELFGCSMSTGETENPANPFVEVFRISQGENPIVFINSEECNGCDFFETCKKNGTSEEDMRKSSRCIECCIDYYVDNYFDEMFEQDRDLVEDTVRDIISDLIEDDLNKLYEIRVKVSDLVTPHEYTNVRTDDWRIRVIDSLVENAMEFGFKKDDDFLESERVNMSSTLEYSDFPTLRRVAGLIEDNKLDEVLEVLK